MKNKAIVTVLFVLAATLLLPAARPQPCRKKKGGQACSAKQKLLKKEPVSRSKYFVRVSYAMGVAGSDQTQSWIEPLYGENTEYSLASKLGHSSNIHAGIGCNLGRSLGVGLGAIILCQRHRRDASTPACPAPGNSIRPAAPPAAPTRPR